MHAQCHRLTVQPRAFAIAACHRCDQAGINQMQRAIDAASDGGHVAGSAAVFSDFLTDDQVETILTEPLAISVR